jgi:hypothetical protein
MLLAGSLFGYTKHVNAWGSDVHSAIGILAMKQLEPGVLVELESIIGPLDAQAITEACNWPDDVRKTEQWKWTAPQHYINVPRGEITYLESRDCPRQQCATEAIKDYATELADNQAGKQERWQAFAWLCHLTGDLHQPMHAGFADDRGGNDYELDFKGEKINLHGFWDAELIYQNAADMQSLVQLLSTTESPGTGANWSMEMVNDWTNDSHELAEHSAYPPNGNIDEAFLRKSWELAQQQIRLAASRLALIINTVLNDSHLVGN